MSGTQERDRPMVAPPRCPYCHEDVARGESITVCTVCHAFHHGACWSELGGCAACGAGRKKPEPIRVQGVATRAAIRERAQRDARRTSVVRALLATVVLAAAGVGLFALVRSTSWHRQAQIAMETDRAPLEVVRELVRLAPALERQPMRAPRERSADLADLVTPASRPFAELVGFNLDFLATPPMHPTGVFGGDVIGRVFVNEGGRRYDLVRWPGQSWRVDLALSPEWTTLVFGQVRLPHGLKSDRQGSEWSTGGLVLGWSSAPLNLETGGLVSETIATLEVKWVKTDDEHGSLRRAVVSRDGATYFEVSALGPYGTGAQLEQILRASLETYEPSRSDPPGERLLVRGRRMLDGFSVTAPEDRLGETVEVTSEPATEDPGGLRELGAPPLLKWTEASGLLPSRSLTRMVEPGGLGGSRLVLNALGYVGNKVYHLRATSLTGASEAVTVLRLTALANSFAPLADEIQWPRPAPLAHAVPSFSSGTFHPPDGWRLTSDGPRLQEWHGYGDDGLEIGFVDGSALAGLPDLAGSRMVEPGLYLVVLGHASSPERQARVSQVAKACLETFEPSSK